MENGCCQKSDKQDQNNGCSCRSYAMTTSEISIPERFKDVLCRFSNRVRMAHRAVPGLYALGNPTPDSPVAVSANYKLSFNCLRSALKGKNIWILVIDTQGVNVWCAAGKGTFGTSEIITRIRETGLASKVNHRKLIVPQLGAPGVSAHKVQKESGFKVYYGPVLASDLPSYIDHNFTATPLMRKVRFTFVDRLKLLPMEITPALRELSIFLFVVSVLMGLTKTGILFKSALVGTWPLTLAGIVSVFAGTILTPLLLPLIPGKAFSLKGLVMGVVATLCLFASMPVAWRNPYFIAFCAVGIPAFSSYKAFLFTGSSTYTSPSGVKKELRIAWPLYLVSTGLCAILLVTLLLHNWNIL